MIIYITIALAILVVGIYFLADRITRQKNVVLQTSSVLRVRFALHSVMDYAFYAIQRRYCFDDTLLPSATCELGTGVVGTTGRSVERVLMSEEQANYIKDMVNVNSVDMKLEGTMSSPLPNPNAVPSTWAIRQVNTIDVAMPAANISALHPLFLIIDPLDKALKQELKDVELYVRIKIERDDSKYIPRAGNEIYFRVTTSFETSTGAVLTIKNNPLQANSVGVPLQVTSFGTMFPREVGTFALMMPRDLRMDGNDALLALHDVGFPLFINGGWTDGGPGLVFKSPVYVNQNIHLPKSPTGRKDKHSRYSPVTFADRVVLGNGRVYEDTDIYKPTNAGAIDDMLWTDNKLFGGFKMGVLVDGYFDEGLRVWGKVVGGTAVDKTLMAQCITREQIKNDATETSKSELYANFISSAANTYNYRFGLTLGNFFNPQNNPMGNASDGQGAQAWESATRTENGPPPQPLNQGIMRVIARIGNDQEATNYLTRQSTLTLLSKAPSNALKNQVEQDLQDAEDAPPPVDTALIETLQRKLDLIIAAQANPGRVTITTAPFVLPTPQSVSTPAPDATLFPSNQAQIGLVDVSISLENPTHFLDDDGNITAPTFEWLAYDPLYRDSALTAPAANPKTTRFLNFTVDNSDPDSPVINAPVRFSTTEGGPIIAESATPPPPYAVALPAYDPLDWVAFDNECIAARGASTGQSFGASAWNTDYSGSTAASWNFAYGEAPVTQATTNVVPDTLVTLGAAVTFNEFNSNLTPTGWAGTFPGVKKPTGRDEFLPYSIVGDCNIEAGAKLVAAFAMCHTLNIYPRTDPLIIIGTFIVRKVEFLGSSNEIKQTLEAGITWMSIYHPEATTILRTAKILRPMSVDPETNDCPDGVTSKPIWATEASSLQQQQDTLKCNVVSLHASTQPFQWTAVDPDCGVEATGAGNTKCKHHPVNYLVMEHGRGGGP